MAVAQDSHDRTDVPTTSSRITDVGEYFVALYRSTRELGARKAQFIAAMLTAIQFTAAADNPRAEAHRQATVMRQMGAKRIGSLAIGIGIVGIVLNQMNNLSIVSNSTGVIDVGSIFQTAGQGLNLLVIGVIIAAAAVLLSLWSGF